MGFYQAVIVRIERFGGAIVHASEKPRFCFDRSVQDRKKVQERF